MRQAERTEYLEDGADIFIENFPARAAYMRWTMLPPQSTRTRIAPYRDVEDLPTIRGDASLLQLARLDAWMAAAIVTEGEEGGARGASLAGVT